MAPGIKTGGRKKGVQNKANAARAAEMAATGETPLAYMIRVMRDRGVDHERRDKMAAAAAPYVHPKLANIEHAGTGGGPIEITTDADRVRALMALMARQQVE